LHALLIEEDDDDARAVLDLLTGRLEISVQVERGELSRVGRASESRVDVVMVGIRDLSYEAIRTVEKLAIALPGVPLVVLYRRATGASWARVVEAGTADCLAKDGLTRAALEHALLRATAERRRRVVLDRHSEERDADLLAARREAERALSALRTAQETMAQKERLLALGTMASGIAHDFNNVLAVVLAYSEFLLDDRSQLEDRQALVGDLEVIRTAARDATRVVRRLRDFFRPRQAGEALSRVHLPKLVDDAVLLTRPRWQTEARAAGIAIDVHAVAGDVPPILADVAELREALANLLLNAIDAMPDGGRITIRTRCEGSHVVLEVEDSGVGMSDETRLRCLEPFFSTKADRGTGLGLVVVHAVAQRHGGDLSIDSTPGVGTKVTLRLPRTEDDVPEEIPSRSQRPARALHVLVVEDEPLVRRALVRCLASEGHSVEEATNGRDGLDRFQRGAFDIVLTDRSMPTMNGDRLALAIRDTGRGTPVVLLTGFGDLHDTGGALPPGVALVVPKPFSPAVLLDAIARAVGSGCCGSTG
jgi:signal transduction histidine kinase/ActR/RegA family two-component response regulator